MRVARVRWEWGGGDVLPRLHLDFSQSETMAWNGESAEFSLAKMRMAQQSGKTQREPSKCQAKHVTAAPPTFLQAGKSSLKPATGTGRIADTCSKTLPVPFYLSIGSAPKLTNFQLSCKCTEEARQNTGTLLAQVVLVSVHCFLSLMTDPTIYAEWQAPPTHKRHLDHQEPRHDVFYFCHQSAFTYSWHLTNKEQVLIHLSGFCMFLLGMKTAFHIT